VYSMETLALLRRYVYVYSMETLALLRRYVYVYSMETLALLCQYVYVYSMETLALLRRYMYVYSMQTLALLRRYVYVYSMETLRQLSASLFSSRYSTPVANFLLPAIAKDARFPFTALLHSLEPADVVALTADNTRAWNLAIEPSVWLLHSMLTLAAPHLGLSICLPVCLSVCLSVCL